MDPSGREREVSLDVFPYVRVYKDGTFERTAGTQIAPPGLDAQTGVLSKDILILPESGVSARVYRPDTIKADQKLPLVVYFHGGAFCISSIADPVYHNSLNLLVAEANVIVVSVDYRRAPEHPLPAAYEDSWQALRWLAGGGAIQLDPWVKDHVDFERVFLAGDSAGANISHHMALRLTSESDPAAPKLKIVGIAMIHPYFWGKDPIGFEAQDHFRKAMVDTWWTYVCPSDKGSDDPLINPFIDGTPSLAGLACGKLIVFVAEKDILRERGKLYFENLVKSTWKGKAQIVETEGEDHVFHIFNPHSEKAKLLIKRLASFINY